MRRNWLLTLLALLCIALMAGIGDASAETGDDGKVEWTVMFYMCGSDLESRYGYASENLEEIAKCTPYFSFHERAPLPGDMELVDEKDVCGLDDVNIIVETGGCKKWHTEKLDMQIDTSALQRWHFQVNLSSYRGDFCLDETLPLRSMADPQTLEDFIRWGAENYPARKYALILWDHGGGSKSGLMVDELFENDFLRLDELGAALHGSGVHLECILLDACMMANVETACAIGDSASWMVGSEEVVGGKGTAVEDWLQQLCYIPEMDGEMLGRLICDTTQIKYSKQEDTVTQEILTWSVIDLSQSERLRTAFDHLFQGLCRVYTDDPLTMINLASKMYMGEAYGEGSDSQWDFGDMFFSDNEHLSDPALRREILAVLKDAVVYCVRGAGRSASRGLSFCNATSLDCEEMDLYSCNCPSAYYLALMDAISPWTAPEWVYESIEKLPNINTIAAYQDQVKKLCTPGGMPVFSFYNDGSKTWAEQNVVRYNLYKADESGVTVKLGSMPVADIFWADGENSKFAYGPSDPAHWPAADGVTCAFEVLSLNRPGWSTMTGSVHLMINGEYSSLRCSCTGSSVVDGDAGRALDEDTWTVHGLWDGYDLKTGMFNRNVRSVAQHSGQEYTLLYPVCGEDPHVNSGNYRKGNPQKMYMSMQITYEPLEDGVYYIEYVIYDLFSRPMYLDMFEMRITDGKASFPDADQWQGVTQLKIPEEYW